MATFIELDKEKSMLSMILKGDIKFPKALKGVMLGMGLYGEAVTEDS